ncbi:MAG: hypothetical protein PUG10_01745, partial [Lachnospiraceae bacterium]|nr:hypothetical protein [Lachnospiraceae bacterium]
RIAKNSIFMSIRMVIVLLITLYSTRVVLDVLGVEDYGIYNVVCGFVSMFAFLNTSMSNGIQRFFNFELGRNGEEGAKNVYNTAVIIQLILGIVILIGAEGVGVWYINNKMVIPPERLFAANWIFQFSLLSFIFIIMQAPYSAAVISHERMDFYAVVSVLDAFLKLGIVFLIPYLEGDDLIWYGILLAGVSLTNFILYFTYCKRKFTEIIFEKGFDRQLFKSMLGFSGWNVFGSFSIMMKDHGVNLVLNLFFGPIVNASRGIATQVNGGINSFVSNITIPVRPQIVQSYAKGDVDRALKLTYGIMKLSSCFFFMISLPICLEINYILGLWLGTNIPDYANTFVVIILATAFTSNLHSAICNLSHATGKMKVFQTVGSCIKLMSVPIAYIFMFLGFTAEVALIVVMVMDWLAHIASCFVLRTLMKFPLRVYAFKVVLPILTTILLSSLIPMLFFFNMNYGVLRVLAVSVSSCLSVIFCVYTICLDDDEKKIFVQMIKGIKNKMKI